MFEFFRTYSFFEPTFTYNVAFGGRKIGAVARIPGTRKWVASNITWAGGREFPNRFPSRYAAADALYFLDQGYTLNEDGSWTEPAKPTTQLANA